MKALQLLNSRHRKSQGEIAVTDKYDPNGCEREDLILDFLHDQSERGEDCWARYADQEILITTCEAAARLRVAPHTLENSRWTGGGPRFYRIGGRLIRYKISDLIAWCGKQPMASTSDRGGENV